jgi:peptidoglycan/xylan/chitin deacetylase (PgdA/CDA1 family)
MMGEYGANRYGIPLICDILHQHDLEGTFFVEPFNAELGYPGETEPVVKYLVEQGQDVQLHIHPNHIHYAQQQSGHSHPGTDQMADLPREVQQQMVEEGAKRLEQWSGTRPVAFRAGNMGASEETLNAMAAAGLWIDSSYTFPYIGAQCRFNEKQRYNGGKWYGEVLEMALSAYQQPKIPGLHPAKPVDLMGSSFEECRDAVRMICDAGADAVLILHSFSLFKVRNKQYLDGRLNRVVTRRFEKFCDWLATQRNDYPPRTFSDLAHLVKEQKYQPKAVEPCTIKRPLRALTRKFVQGMNNFYWI